MDNPLKAISILERLNLSKYPYDDIAYCLGVINKFGTLKTTLQPGTVIYKAVPNEVNQHFNKRSQITYPPLGLNLVCKRATTPDTTMFYGSIIPPNSQPDELKLGRVIGAFESLDLMSSTELSGEQTLTYGKWVVTKPISLVSILSHEPL